MYFTGSEEFNKNMRGVAVKKGYTLNEYCLRKVGATERMEVTCEKDVFDFLGMEFKKPEERNI